MAEGTRKELDGKEFLAKVHPEEEKRKGISKEGDIKLLAPAKEGAGVGKKEEGVSVPEPKSPNKRERSQARKAASRVSKARTRKGRSVGPRGPAAKRSLVA